jgi:hypothetical protein
MRTRELERLEEIEASGWRPKIDQSPRFSNDPTDSILRPLHYRSSYSALEFLHLVLGSWLERVVQPYIDQGLKIMKQTVAEGSSKHYRPLRSRELLAYILYRSIEALQKHKKHDIAPGRLADVAARLCSEKRRGAISGRFAVKSNILEDILASWTAHICSFAQPGSLSVADEAMFPHFGKKADDERLLQQICGKPHDFGLISYILAQRLQHSDLPIALALSINHLTQTLTPTGCVLKLHSAVVAADPNGPAKRQLVVDSLWSAASTLEAFDLHGIQYCVSVKTDSKVIPAPLFEVAASDLPTHTSRTHTNGSSTFEVVNADKHTVRLLTNMYAEDTEPVANHTRKGSYKTAVHLFDNESPQELVRIFQLDETWATKASALIIYHHLGWDVLRSEAQQGTNATLTYADAKGMKVSQLRAIRAQMLPRARQSVGTKEDMLHELFPNEQREVDETRAAEQGQKRKRRSREKLRDLALIRERVRIHF